VLRGAVSLLLLLMIRAFGMTMITYRCGKTPQIGHLRSLLLATTAFIAFSNVAHAQTWEWDGSVSTDWFEAGN